jgi:hypothetical protein
MKKKLAIAFLFFFTLALTAPVMAGTLTQEPEKKECANKSAECDKKKSECDSTKKASCDKAEKKACCDKEKK